MTIVISFLALSAIQSNPLLEKGEESSGDGGNRNLNLPLLCHWEDFVTLEEVCVTESFCYWVEVIVQVEVCF